MSHEYIVNKYTLPPHTHTFTITEFLYFLIHKLMLTVRPYVTMLTNTGWAISSCGSNCCVTLCLLWTATIAESLEFKWWCCFLSVRCTWILIMCWLRTVCIFCKNTLFQLRVWNRFINMKTENLLTARQYIPITYYKEYIHSSDMDPVSFNFLMKQKHCILNIAYLLLFYSLHSYMFKNKLWRTKDYICQICRWHDYNRW